MNKWAARIIGLLLLVVLALIFMQMQRTLLRLQQERAVVPSSR